MKVIKLAGVDTPNKKIIENEKKRGPLENAILKLHHLMWVPPAGFESIKG